MKHPDLSNFQSSPIIIPSGEALAVNKFRQGQRESILLVPRTTPPSSIQKLTKSILLKSQAVFQRYLSKDSYAYNILQH